MVTADELGRQYADALNHLRVEIDAAYRRGYDDGAQGRLVALLTGLLSGALSMGVWMWIV